MKSKWIHELNGFENIKPQYKIFENGDVVSYRAMKSDGNTFHHYISDKPQRVLKPYSDGHKGYLRVDLRTDDDKRKVGIVHRLVAIAFIPNPENKPQVNHIDANKINNHANNLEWVTNQENHNHKLKMGLNVSIGGDKHYTQQGEYKNFHHNWQKVQQLDLNGNVINTFKSVKDAAIHVGIHYTTISHAIKKNGTAKGFKWRKMS